LAILYDSAHIGTLPTSGADYNNVLGYANQTITADFGNIASKSDQGVLAAALVGVRLNNSTYLDKAKNGITAHIGQDSYCLTDCRNLPSLIIAADVMEWTGAAADDFTDWVTWLRNKTGNMPEGQTPDGTYGRKGDNSMHDCAYNDPSNWGCEARCAIVCADLWLGNSITAHVQRFRDYLGESNSGWNWEETSIAYSWQPYYPPTRWGILPVGATKSGFDLSGCEPEDARREGNFALPVANKQENYHRQAFQGTALLAAILTYQGYDVTAWSANAIDRIHNFVVDVAELSWEVEDDGNSPWLVNYACGTSHPAPSPSDRAKNFGYASWTHRDFAPPDPEPPPSGGRTGGKLSSELYPDGGVVTYGAALSTRTWTGAGGGVWGAKLTDTDPGGAPSGSQIAHTNRMAVANGTDGTSFTLTPATAKAAGEIAILAVDASANASVTPGQPSSVTGRGLTWTHIATLDYDTAGTSRGTLSVWRGTGSDSGSGDITVTFGTTCLVCIAIMDCFTNVSASTPIVQSVTSAANATGTSNTVTFASLADSINNGLWHAACHRGIADDMTADTGAGYTAAGEIGSSQAGGIRLETQWRIGGAIPSTFTWGSVLLNGGIGIELDQA
jgi:hypothetical protein